MDGATSSRRSNRLPGRPVRRRALAPQRELVQRPSGRSGERVVLHGEDVDPPQDFAPPRDERAG